jgi:hypothetical protein
VCVCVWECECVSFELLLRSWFVACLHLFRINQSSLPNIHNLCVLTYCNSNCSEQTYGTHTTVQYFEGHGAMLWRTRCNALKDTVQCFEGHGAMFWRTRCNVLKGTKACARQLQALCSFMTLMRCTYNMCAWWCHASETIVFLLSSCASHTHIHTHCSTPYALNWRVLKQAGTHQTSVHSAVLCIY